MKYERLSGAQLNMIKKEKEKAEAYSKIRRYCEYCGHTVYVPKQFKKTICNYCGHTVYYDEKEKFKDKLQREMRK